MRFLIDAQLPPALARQLRSLDHEAEHVNDIALGGAPDTDIWSYAVTAGAILITKDGDFAHLARQPTGTPVVWIRLGNTTNTALWRTLEPLLAEMFDALEGGERLIEIA